MSNVDTGFAPLGISVAVTTVANGTSPSTALPGAGGSSCRVVNTNTNPVSVTFSTVSGGAVATATGEIVNSGQDKVFSIPYNTIDCAVWGIGAGVLTTYFQRGDGV